MKQQGEDRDLGGAKLLVHTFFSVSLFILSLVVLLCYCFSVGEGGLKR